MVNHNPQPKLRRFNQAKSVKSMEALIEKVESHAPLEHKDYQLLRKWGVVKRKGEIVWHY